MGHKWVIFGSHPDFSVGQWSSGSTAVTHFQPCAQKQLRNQAHASCSTPGIAIPLSIIFKKSFNSRILPHHWKNAQVTPIHKKCARNQVCNYHPVSLKSIFSKFMESIVKDHLMSHLLANNLLSDYQFGFIPGRSCTTQLLYMYVLDYFTQHLDQGDSVDAIYSDFQKAFDSVPHQHLIEKLSSYGIHSNILQ